MTRVLILAAGSGTRWGDFRGAPKHVIDVEGEMLLSRIARQFLEHTDDVVVVAPPGDDRYKIPGTRLYVPDVFGGRELEKFSSSLGEWSEDERTVLVYGDVYFTDEAVETVMGNSEPWKYFCRSVPSKVTGKACKEIFAISFMPEKRQWMANAIMSIINMTTTTGGWSLFRLLTLGTSNVAASDQRMFDTGNHVEIDDWTEDFDYPQDLVRWETRRAEFLRKMSK